MTLPESRGRLVAFLFLATVFSVSFQSVFWNVAGRVNLADVLAVLFLVAFVGSRVIRRDGLVPRTTLAVLGFAIALLVVYPGERTAACVVHQRPGLPVDSIRAVHGLLQRILNAAEAQGSPPTVTLAREVLEGSQPKPPRKASTRSSGVVAAAGGIKSREKIVWDWPDVGDRIVEEWR